MRDRVSHNPYRVSRGELFFLLAWTVLAVAAYLFQIDVRSLWLDEAMSLDVARRPWSEMWPFFQGLPEQHPVYYLLLAQWVGAFGESEFAVRSLSVVFALAGGWVSYFLARRLFGRRVAVLTAGLLLLSPFWLYFAQEARMYTLLGFLALASHLLYLRWADGYSWAGWGYIVVGIVGAYTHLFFLFVPLAHLLIAVDEHRNFGPEVRRRAVAVAAIGVAYLPWASLILTDMPSGQGWKGLKHLVFGLPYIFFRFSVGYSELIPVAGWKQDVPKLLMEHGPIMAATFLVFGALAFAGVVAAHRRGRSGRFVLLGIIVPLVAMYALSTVTILVGERYQIVIFPLYVILLALAVDWLVLRARGRRLAAGCLLVALALTLNVNSLLGHYRNDLSPKAEWREAARFVAEHARDGDRLIYHEDFVDLPFEYYYDQLSGPELTTGRLDIASPRAGETADRLWVIVSHAPQGSECAETLRSADRGENVTLVRHRRFPSGAGIEVFLLDLADEAPRESGGLPGMHEACLS